MSNHEYNEWFDKVNIGMWSINWSPQCIFLSQVGKKLAWPTTTFHTEIEWVWTDSSNSHQLDPSNASS